MLCQPLCTRSSLNLCSPCHPLRLHGVMGRWISTKLLCHRGQQICRRTIPGAALFCLIEKFQKLTHYFCRIRKQSNFVLLIAVSRNLQVFGLSSSFRAPSRAQLLMAFVWSCRFHSSFPGPYFREAFKRES